MEISKSEMVKKFYNECVNMWTGKETELEERVLKFENDMKKDIL